MCAAYLTTQPEYTPGQFGSKADVLAFAMSTCSMLLNAFAGLVINFHLAATTSAVVVGQFNQILILYMLAGQCASCGAHLSCLHHQSLEPVTSSTWRASAIAACIVAVCAGLFVCVVLILGADAIARLLNADIAFGIVWMAPAATLFGLNKVRFALYNAADKLLTLAFVQGVRPVVWLITLWMVLLEGSPSPDLFGKLLLYGELAVLASAMLFRATCQPFPTLCELYFWFAKHARFGLRAILSHLAIELHFKIDVLILAFFSDGAVVGIYSFVALLAEGISKGGFLIRTIITRRLTNTLAARDKKALYSLTLRAGGWNLGLTAAASAVLLALYAPGLAWLGMDPNLSKGLVPLGILLAGIVVCALWAPFLMNLLLAGYPLAHTTLMLTLCAFSILLTVLFVPTWGMYGAAIGTASMFAAFPPLLAVWMRSTLGFTCLKRA